MNIWKTTSWKKDHCVFDKKIRTGLYCRYEKGVDPELIKYCKSFAEYLRREYVFPIRVVIYYKKAYRIKAMDGEYVCGTFFGPFNKNEEPYIRISTGDYQQLIYDIGKVNAVGNILHTVAHELTHYFQWINDAEYKGNGGEISASKIAKRIVNEFLKENGML